MTLTRYGKWEWGAGGVAALLLTAGFLLLARGCCPVTGSILAGFTVLAYFCVAMFFRNPVRKLPDDPALLVSPADGVVKDIGVVDFDMAPFEGKALRIGIFLSVLDVHVNRASADLEVLETAYRPGKYLDARHPDCHKLNEARTISGRAAADGRTFPMAIRQISGAIARRIVCPVEKGRRLKRGEIYGMIKFGSRTELYLPPEGFDVLVKVGDTVRGGRTALAGPREAAR